MLPRIAYRQFHDQSNTAVVAMAVMHEFSLASLAAEERGSELTFHGVIQRGPYQEGRGMLLRNALKHLSDGGLKWTMLYNPSRGLALQEYLRRWVPDFTFRFVEDLGGKSEAWPDWDSVFADNARVILVEAKHSIRELPLHLLLARREGGTFYVMNSATGRDHEYEAAYFVSHLASPVNAGTVSFAGMQYVYTGVGIRITK